MVDGNAPLSAAERRERRLKRILGDGENRIKRILSGPSGGIFISIQGTGIRVMLCHNGEVSVLP